MRLLGRVDRVHFDKHLAGIDVVDEALAAILSRGRRSPSRFVIYGQGRSGSTLLETLLDSHPDIRCEGELLKVRRLGPQSFLDNRAKLSSAQAFGCHVKPHMHVRHVQRLDDLRGFAEAMLERGWSIVHLRRDNVAAQTLSVRIAMAAAKFHHRTGDGERMEAIRLDPEHFVRRLDVRATRLMEEEEALRGLPTTPVRYERDLSTPELMAKSLPRIQEALGVEVRELTTPLRKSVDRPAREAIANYDEIETAVAGTPFAPMLAALN